MSSLEEGDGIIPYESKFIILILVEVKTNKAVCRLLGKQV